MKKIIAALLFCTILLHTNVFAQNKIEIEFKTGEDDLRGIGTPELNPDVNLLFVNKPALLTRGFNRNLTWPKNSIRKISIPLDTSIVVADLLAMELSRKHSNANVPTTKSPDNWDIDRIIVTATFKKNGQTTKYELLNSQNTNPKLTPWRMTYDNSETPKRFDFRRNPVVLSGTQNWIDKFPPPQKASISATFGVGGDDLRGGNDNAKIVITFKNSTKKLTFNNLNNGAQWNGFTEHTSFKQIPSFPEFTINDINAVELWHTGGGGMGADNWDIDKFTLTVTYNGQSKQVVNKTGAPIHRFSGDARKKVFVVE